MSSHVQSSCPLHGFLRERNRPGSPGARIAFFVLGLIAYGAFLGTILYAIGFIGGWIVPKSIDSGNAESPLPSMIWDAALLLVFVGQHTVMARPGFKRLWTRVVPQSIERSVFVLAASAALALVFWQWRPIPQEVWRLKEPAWAWLVSALSLVGWTIVFSASFMVDHFDLFGLRQVWLRLLGRPYRPVGFRLVGLYRFVRHPLMFGFLIAFWATPVMTLGHLFFAIMITLYIAFGVWMEERDLVAEQGQAYMRYRRDVTAIIPWKGRLQDETQAGAGARA